MATFRGYQAVSKALQSRTQEAVDSLRDLETARLDALQQGVWDRAMNGDVAAARAAPRIIVARCRLLGLDAPSLIQEPDRPPVRPSQAARYLSIRDLWPW